MTANPIELVGGLTTTANVPKTDIAAWAKARVPQVLADATELRNTLLAGQLVIYIKALGINYYLDTADTTTADDGVNCIISLDGKRFKPSTVLAVVSSLNGLLGSITIAGTGAASVSAVGSTITVDVPVTVVSGVWHVSNLTAFNNVATPATKMDITADAAMLYNPSTGQTKTIIGPIAKSCSISSFTAGARDQSAAFASGNAVWFYLIWGSVPGLNTICSLTTAVGGGPVLPSGYTHFCPLFVLPLVGSATLQPTLPQGGATTFKIEGNTVKYANSPDLIGVGYPNMVISLAPWIPLGAKLTNFAIDAEFFGATAVIGGAVGNTPDGNFCNISLYPPLASSLYAGEVPCSVSLWSRLQIFTITFLVSAGTVSVATGDVLIDGYTFGN